MRTANILAAAIAIFTTACSDQCDKETASGAPIVDDGDGIIEKGGCCLTPATPELANQLCETHPFGRAIGCGGVEEPQTTENCSRILRLNDDICTADYIECREAIRLAACDECPAACDGVTGAC